MGRWRAGVSRREGCWPARGGDMSRKEGETVLQREVDGEERQRTRHTGRQVEGDGERPRESERRTATRWGKGDRRQTQPVGAGGGDEMGQDEFRGRECRGSRWVVRV